MSSPAVARFARVPASTLDYWVTTGLLRPSIRGSRGRRYDRWWSVPDAVTARSIRVLRDAGCPLQRVRRAHKLITQHWSDDIAASVLYWDGADVLAIDGWGSLRSTIKHPGQQVLHLTVLPVDAWLDEARGEAIPLDRGKVREVSRRGVTPTAAVGRRLA